MPFHGGDTDTGFLQIGEQLSTECICPYLADELHRIPKARHSDCLIRAFSSGMHLKIAAAYGFTRDGNFFSARYEIDIDTAHHHDRLLTG
jgi:hypothetical protein